MWSHTSAGHTGAEYVAYHPQVMYNILEIRGARCVTAITRGYLSLRTLCLVHPLTAGTWGWETAAAVGGCERTGGTG